MRTARFHSNLALAVAVAAAIIPALASLLSKPPVVNNYIQQPAAEKPLDFVRN